MGGRGGVRVMSWRRRRRDSRGTYGDASVGIRGAVIGFQGLKRVAARLILLIAQQ